MALFSLFSLQSPSLFAYCEVSNLVAESGFTATNGTGGFGLGQTFTACETGTVSQIKFSVFAPGDFTAELRIAPNPGITSSWTANWNPPASSYLENITVSATAANEVITITLTTPFAVTSGTSYAFGLHNFNITSGVAQIYTNNPSSGTSNPYAGGEAFQINNGQTNTEISVGQAGNSDMFFTVVHGTPPVVANNVPTLSQWGLIVLALLLMTFGTLYLVNINRREYSFMVDKN